MTIRQTKEGEKLTMAIEGRLDTTTAPELEAAVTSSIAGVKELVMDFEQLNYVASAGLRVILKAQKTMNTQGSMVIKNVNATIKEVFEITGFVDVLTIE